MEWRTSFVDSPHFISLKAKRERMMIHNNNIKRSSFDVAVLKNPFTAAAAAREKQAKKEKKRKNINLKTEIKWTSFRS